MKTYMIRYRDPQTEEIVERTAEFHDDHDIEIRMDDGTYLGKARITALSSAEDLGYTLADKGWYEVEEIENTTRKDRRGAGGK